MTKQQAIEEIEKTKTYVFYDIWGKEVVVKLSKRNLNQMLKDFKDGE